MKKRKELLKEILEVYLSRISEEDKEEEMIKRRLEKIKEEEDFEKFIGRKNDIHFTVSMFILVEDKILLVKEQEIEGIDKIQIGTHLEKGKDIFESLMEKMRKVLNNKVKEDDLEYIPFFINMPYIPIDIDIHDITKENEENHTHIDFRYIFKIKEEKKDLYYKTAKLGNVEFVRIDELKNKLFDNAHGYSRMIRKISYLFNVNNQPSIFYNKLLENYKYRIMYNPEKQRNKRKKLYLEINSGKYYFRFEKVGIICVVHLLPDVKEYLEAIDSVFKIIKIIPKKSSFTKKDDVLYEKYKNLIYESEKEITKDEMEKWIKFSDIEKLIILDIGGYFSNISITKLNLKNSNNKKVELLGIIEDTENGYNKYKNMYNKNGNKIRYPIFSISDSVFKQFEDFLVGQSILFSMDYFLRLGVPKKPMNYLRIGVIGYGEIGSSICNFLNRQGIKPVVYDVNPVKRMKALNEFCMTVDSLYEILRTSDVIVCATDNSSIKKTDWKFIKSGSVVISVTSPDDEFGIPKRSTMKDFLGNINYRREKVANHIDKYVSPLNYFYLINDGQAINFVHQAVIGDFIHAVKAIMLLWAINLAFGDKKYKKDIYSMFADAKEREKDTGREEMFLLANIWMKVFGERKYEKNLVG